MPCYEIRMVSRTASEAIQHLLKPLEFSRMYSDKGTSYRTSLNIEPTTKLSNNFYPEVAALIKKLAYKLNA